MVYCIAGMNFRRIGLIVLRFFIIPTFSLFSRCHNRAACDFHVSRSYWGSFSGWCSKMTATSLYSVARGRTFGKTMRPRVSMRASVPFSDFGPPVCSEFVVFARPPASVPSLCTFFTWSVAKIGLGIAIRHEAFQTLRPSSASIGAVGHVWYVAGVAKSPLLSIGVPIHHEEYDLQRLSLPPFSHQSFLNR